ncbi:ATPase or kinase [Oceanicola sp. 22II-s10i]|uniref:tRNA (adenosine(37)-N6)-threonylcarbamoyltransferase complex ATPase subunit type 1 TsaE n=1 Tax=Oceanicola sp. 22II-s10i TaxID=1317116 RepID=UPI000B523824|nr:tRNA (adenosine(37)-N6)-threonylcarbamoyltransferase complex ATPase subunit type 1 TsaE [Oceanicola sp. 22II-s10i]OWU85964.1 ATPase or kinase [Oceanicola sp. 22II-s10i]
MGNTTCQIDLPTPDATTALARRIGALLRPGDVLLLEGGIGAGKTHFARALIQSLLQEPEDVPSPTFTLVQIYDSPHGEIWHADLYRLGHPDEVAELGLTEAFETAICLVEWPDRLGELMPDSALFLGFALAGDSARTLTITGDPARWRHVLDEAALV